MITGSFCSLNNGDLAMCYGFKEMMSSLGTFSFTVLSMYPHIEPERYGIRVVGFPTIPKYKFGLNLIAINIAALLYRLTCKKIGSKIFGKEFDAYAKSDLIVDLSGDGYSDEITPLGSIVHSLQLLPGIFLGKKIFICAQSIGPFSILFTRMLSKAVLNKVSLLTVREQLSKKYLKSIGVKQDIIVTSDCAFGMSPHVSKKIDEWHTKFKKWKEKENIIVCVSLSKRLSRFIFPEVKDRKQKYGLYVETFANILDYLLNRYNCMVVFVPHVLGPPPVDDRYTHRDIVNHIKQVEKVVLIEETFKADEMKAIISKADFLISARMHALIAAYSTGVPGVAIGYSHKYKGIVGEMLNLDSVFVDVRFLKREELYKQIIEKINFLVDNKDRLIEHLNKIVPNVKKCSMQNCKMAIKLLGGYNE